MPPIFGRFPGAAYGIHGRFRESRTLSNISPGRAASAQDWHVFPTSAGSQHQRCVSIPAQANGLGTMRHDAEGLKARFIVSNETRN